MTFSNPTATAEAKSTPSNPAAVGSQQVKQLPHNYKTIVKDSDSLINEPTPIELFEEFQKGIFLDEMKKRSLNHLGRRQSLLALKHRRRQRIHSYLILRMTRINGGRFTWQSLKPGLVGVVTTWFGIGSRVVGSRCA
ncbi:hypothetical protein FF2_035837 [Malus domestica]